MADHALSPIVLTAADVAAMLQVDVGTVEKLARRGKLAKVRFMGQTRFRRSDVEEFIERNMKPCRLAEENYPGSDERPENQIGTSTGMTPVAGQSADARRARETIKKLTRSLAGSSPPAQKRRRSQAGQSNQNAADVLQFAPKTAP